MSGKFADPVEPKRATPEVFIGDLAVLDPAARSARLRAGKAGAHVLRLDGGAGTVWSHLWVKLLSHDSIHRLILF